MESHGISVRGSCDGQGTVLERERTSEYQGSERAARGQKATHVVSCKSRHALGDERK